MSETRDMWSFRPEASGPEGVNLIGFKVHATDGNIGHVDDATTEAGSGHIVVDTGPWIFGHRVVLPAGTVERVDWENEEVWLKLTKQQIKDSPDFDKSRGYEEEEHRDQIGGYYGGLFGRAGMPPWDTQRPG